METNSGPRSSQLNLHHRHPHYSNNTHHSHHSHKPPNHQQQQHTHHRQHAGRRQHLGAVTDESHAARETSDGSLSFTRTTAAPALLRLHTTSDNRPCSHQLLVSSSIYGQHRRSLPKQTQNQHQHQQLFPLAPLLPPSTARNTLSSITSTSSVATVSRAAHYHHVPCSLQQPRPHQHNDYSHHTQRERIRKAQTDNLQSHPTEPFFGASLVPQSNDAQRDPIRNTHVNFSDYDDATMDPPSPESASTLPTSSSSSDESTRNALLDRRNSLVDTEEAHQLQLRESSETTSSPPSHGASTDSESDSLKNSLPEPSGRSSNDAFHGVQRIPFRFPDARRNGTDNNSNISVFTQPTTLEPTAGFFGYCFDRGNGLYTRLVPADMLSPTAGLAPVQNDCRGMVVLQDPLAQPLPGVPSSLSPPGLASMSAAGSAGYESGQVQQNFGAYGAMPAPHPTPIAPFAPIVQRTANGTKKNKVYCDKWVHEGICAFTQQGCKFKHEMPHDRVIQRSLGLFQGYPNWYKKLQPHDQPGEGPATLSLPAPPGMEPSGQHNHHTTFASSLVSLSSPPSFASLPAPPPHPQMPRHPVNYQVFGSTVNDHVKSVLGGGSGIDRHWRPSGPSAVSWRSQQVAKADIANTGNANSSISGCGSADRLTDSFVRNMSLNEPLGNGEFQNQQQQQPTQYQFHQATQQQQHYQEQQTGTTSELMGSLSTIPTYPIGFAFGHGPLGALVDNDETELRLGSAGSGFGPIGPPTRISQETSSAVGYRGSQTLSDDLGHDGGSSF